MQVLIDIELLLTEIHYSNAWPIRSPRDCRYQHRTVLGLRPSKYQTYYSGIMMTE